MIILSLAIIILIAIESTLIYKRGDKAVFFVYLTLSLFTICLAMIVTISNGEYSILKSVFDLLKIKI